MIFQTPQWKWRGASEQMMYGFVSNTVLICPAHAKSITTFVVVPTEFFQLLSLIFNDAQNAHLAVVGARFYLDEDDGVWVFGVGSVDDLYAVELWPYILSSTPPWGDLALRRGR
jgi:hypothetical protein